MSDDFIRMLRRSLRSIRRHKLLTGFIILLTALVALNVVACLHARSMTHFVRAGVRTASPEQLSALSKLRVLLTGVTVPRPANHRSPSDCGLSFTTLHASSTNGIDLELWHVPAQPDHTSHTMVLLFHAYASSKQMMLPIARELHAMGYDTLLVDFRGSGGSSGSETTIGYREADDVIAAATFARREFSSNRIIMFGDSMGASAVLRAASLDPKLADAIIVDAPFDRLLSTVENRFIAMKLPSFPFARLICFWGGLQHGYDAFGHNPSDYAEKIACPVLHLHGEHDPRVTLAQARDLFNRFAGPKEFVVFDGAGHADHLAIDRERWTQHVRKFIDQGEHLGEECGAESGP